MKKLNLNSFLLKISVLIGSTIPLGTALAQQTTQEPITSKMIKSVSGSSLANIPSGGIESVIGSIIQVFLSVFGVVFLSLIVYGGYIWLKAQGREEEVKRAKDTIRSAIVGIIITLAAYTISYFVLQALTQVTPIK